MKEVEAVAIKRVIAHQIHDEMNHKKFTKTLLAKKMHTSRSAVERLFEPENESVTLVSLNRAASALGKKLRVELV